MLFAARSHQRGPPQNEERGALSSRTSSSRIPVKPTIPELKSRRAVHQVTRAERRTSRSSIPTEKPSSKSIPVPMGDGAPATAIRRKPVAVVAVVAESSPTPMRSAIRTTITTTTRTPQQSALNLPPAIRTPSLVSGSSVSTFDSPRSIGLRRKPSNVGRRVSQTKEDFGESFGDTILGISLPAADKRLVTNDSVHSLTFSPTASRNSSEIRMWSNAGSEIAPSHSTLSHVTTPSTRFSDSPFSHAPTPSSVSSYSSSIPAPTPVSATLSPQSPPRVKALHNPEKVERHVSRQPLAPVRESSVSSNSSANRRNPLTTRKTHAVPSTSRSYAAPTSSSRRRDRSPPPIAFNQTPPLQPIQIPPELAHLNVETPRRPSVDKALPPPRPSRDGAATLADLTAPATVVRSDLPRLFTTYRKRASSQDLQTPVSSAVSSRLGASPRPSSRATIESPRIDSAISPPPSARATEKVSRKSEPVTREKRVLRKASPAIVASPSPSKSTSRFGIFSRKSKNEPSKSTEEHKLNDKPKRVPSKGPAAGTGHEGYGRFGSRPRVPSFQGSPDILSSGIGTSTGSLSKSSSKRKVSVGSSLGEPELDDFLRARLVPVVLRGSASSVTSDQSTTNSATEIRELHRVDSSAASSVDSYPTPQLLPSAMRDRDSSVSSVETSLRPARRLPSDNSEPVISPSRTHALTDASLSQHERSMYESEGLWLRPQRLAAPARPAYRWNFFQRAAQAFPPKSQGHNDLDVPSNRSRNVHPVSHYAMMDPMESVALADVEQVLHDDDGYSPREGIPRMALVTPEPSMTPTKPVAASPQRKDAQLLQPEESPKQSRLSPVGRIPRVVSKRDRDRKLPDNSFSRPFARTQPHPNVRPPGALYHSIRELASPIDGLSQPDSGTSPSLSGPKQSASTASAHLQNISTSSTSSASIGIQQGREFFALPPRKDSDISYASSHASWLAALSAQPPQEDDPWAEYNDLIDDMLPQRTTTSAGLPHGASFPCSEAMSMHSSSAMSPLAAIQPPPFIGLPILPDRVFDQQDLSLPQQIARFLQPSMSPLTPPTMHHSGFGQRDSLTSSRDSRGSVIQDHYNSGEKTIQLMKRSSREGNVLRHSQGSIHSRSASLPEASIRNSQNSLLSNSSHFQRTTPLVDIVEDEAQKKTGEVGLRFAALMTSRWLSFGRVLFSPAHNELNLAEDPRILIVDGLGSDWSYYVALTYPSAMVYNLGPVATPYAEPILGEDTPKPPSNHRHIPHTGISAAFPFPKGFFHAVVFRFPVANTPEAYNDCIFECKRVLRPGGYLEVAVLDLDLTNMGQRARRAVRNLKISMQQHDCNVDLGNLSDVLIRLIGRRGFEDVQRCIVGVPASGSVPGSQDNTSGDAEPEKPGQVKSLSREFDFTSLLKLSRTSQFEPGKENDEDMTKMVASVGRWWYSTCYETPILADGSRSLWQDSALLRECEKQGSKFRLLICHAQKPMQTRRRTVSV